MSDPTVRAFLTNPLVETLGAAPLFLVLCVREALHAAGGPDRQLVVRRLGWISVGLLVVFVALVVARFAALAS
jgi:hypothetical protein